MTHAPLISVLMPAYNSASFIGAAIESILGQTYTHLELLVIDDGSTDETSAIAAVFCEGDPRVQIHPQLHAGRVAARNYALSLAQGEYFAWLDADDLAKPHRLERQVATLQSNPQLMIVGSTYQAIDEYGVPQFIHKMPLTDTMIRWHCLFHSPFAQSSVMMRRDGLQRNGLCYDPTMQEAEDYELWSQLLQHGKGCNLPEALVQYRQHPKQASQQGQPAVWDFAGRVAQKNLITLGAPLPIDEVQRLREWFYHFPARLEPDDLPLAESLLDILNRFSVQPGLEQDEVERVRGRWLGKLLRAGSFQNNVGWFLRMLSRLKYRDYSAVMAYLREREKLV